VNRDIELLNEAYNRLIVEDDDRPHYHLIIRLELEEMPDKAEDLTSFVDELANEIGMKIVYGPKAIHLPYPETEGWSCFAIITSSHISVHTWNKSDPPLMQVDIFSCNAFSKKKVIDFVNSTLKVKNIKEVFIDRTSALKVETQKQIEAETE
jgi:S-adenosylmethionine/arginine decarboxylase-like enzyme